MTAKNTFFKPNDTLNCAGKLVDLSTPKVMGILNVTPDSFYSGSRIATEKALLQQAELMLQEGATFLDVGGVSTRPGAGEVPLDEELKRVVPAVKSLVNNFPEAVISVDSYRSEVIQRAAGAGAGMVNDISAGRFDDALFNTVAQSGLPYVLMHMQGSPANMQQQPDYTDVVQEVYDFLKAHIMKLESAGVTDIVIDMGFGFGKTVAHNYQLLRQMDTFKLLGKPVLAGLSRKSMACRVLDVKPDAALNATTVLNTLALQQGAKILRVHDVHEAQETVSLMNYYNNAIA